MFLQLILATSQTTNVPEAKTWETVLDHWWRQVRPYVLMKRCARSRLCDCARVAV
jgi:hypothetical protein